MYKIILNIGLIILCFGTFTTASTQPFTPFQVASTYWYERYKSAAYKKKYRKKQRNYSGRVTNARTRRHGTMPSSIPAPGRNTFVFNPNKLMWGAYTPSGRLINSGIASGGRDYCHDVRRRCKTPVGNFRVGRKGGPGCVSSKFPLGRGGAPMPYCMFFYHGYAIHGSYDVPAYNASHGCIRVLPSAARWLSQNFMSSGTKVKVIGY